MGGNGGGKGNGGGQQPQQAANGAEEAAGGFQRAPRRPIGRIAAGWSCSAGSVYDVARRLLWKEHTW